MLEKIIYFSFILSMTIILFFTFLNKMSNKKGQTIYECLDSIIMSCNNVSDKIIRVRFITIRMMNSLLEFIFILFSLIEDRC